MVDSRDLAEKMRARRTSESLLQNLPVDSEGFPATARLRELSFLLKYHTIEADTLHLISQEIEGIRARLNKRDSYLRSIRGQA